MKKSRTFRKSFVSAIAALCLAAPLAVVPVTVSADGSYSITITATDSANTHNYVAYQIFSGDYDGTVLSNINWGSGVNTTELVNGKTLVEAIKEVDSGFADLTDTSASAIAKKLSDYTNNESVIKRFAEVIGDYLTTPSGTSSASGVTDLSAGYYLVQDNGTVTGQAAKTRYILQVAGANVEVIAKSSYPTITKKVKENTDVVDYSYAYQDYNDIADYDIGDDIPIVDIGTLPETLGDYDKYYYEIVDTSDKSLKPDTTLEGTKVTDGVTVKIDGVEVTKQATITEETDVDGNIVIKVVFEDIKSIKQGDDNGGTVNVTSASKVTVEYNANLTKQAYIGLIGQESEVYLNFSNDPNENYNPDASNGMIDKPNGVGKTPPDKVIVFTYQIDITKYLDSNEGNLAGVNEAGFKLFKSIEDIEYVAEIDNTTGAVTWITATYDGDRKSNNGTEIKTDASGKVKFVGIDEGSYVLKETTTPVGYNTMPDMPISIVADTKDNDTKGVDVNNERQNWSANAEAALKGLTCDQATSVDLYDGAVKFEIINVKGSTLPSTGGIGTTIFYLGGGTMAAVAGVYLITKKRMKNEEDDEI